MQAYEIFIITVNVVIFHPIKLEGKMFFHVLNYEYLISRCVNEEKHHLVILQKNKSDTLHRQTHKLNLTKTNYFRSPPSKLKNINFNSASFKYLYGYQG